MGRIMQAPPNHRFGSFAVSAGALLLASYAALFPIVLPIGPASSDYLQMLASPWWRPLAGTALIGVLLLLAGLDAVYATIQRYAGLSGWIGLGLLKIALALQASKLVGQLLFEPLLAAHPHAAFLLRDGVMMNDPMVAAFRIVSSVVLVLGVGMFGAALYRSGVFPKSAVALIGAGAFAYAVGFFVSLMVAVAGVVALAAGCVAVGLRLLARVEA